jgi:hypothetical protein
MEDLARVGTVLDAGSGVPISPFSFELLPSRRLSAVFSLLKSVEADLRFPSG